MNADELFIANLSGVTFGALGCFLFVKYPYRVTMLRLSMLFLVIALASYGVYIAYS